VLLSALIQCVCVHDITNDTPAMWDNWPTGTQNCCSTLF